MSIAPPLRTIIVGCGSPKVSMGWFHLHQLLDNPSVDIFAVVEPWLLGKGAGTPGAADFGVMRAEMGHSHPNCQFFVSVSELDSNLSDDGPVLAIVAARTADAPRLFGAYRLDYCLPITSMRGRWLTSPSSLLPLQTSYVIRV